MKRRLELLAVELRAGDVVWVSLEEGWCTIASIREAPPGALWSRIATFTDGTTLNLVTGSIYPTQRP